MCGGGRKGGEGGVEGRREGGRERMLADPLCTGLKKHNSFHSEYITTEEASDIY